jgi:hypothetical protein
MHLRYKDAYTSCYICNANARMHKRKTKHMLHKELHHELRKPTTHTKLTNNRLLEGRQKGLDTTGKREKKHKNHKLPLNTCTRAKEHTKLTLSTHHRAKSTLSTQTAPKLMH